MTVKENQREIMERKEVEAAMEVKTSLFGVKESAVGTMTTFGEVREVAFEVVTKINSVEEVEAIAITTNLKVP